MTGIAKSIGAALLLFGCALVWADDTKSAALDVEMEDVKKALVELKRDLVIPYKVQ